MAKLTITVASGTEFAVTHFSTHDALSTLFSVSVFARSYDPAVDLGAIVGQPAAFNIDASVAGTRTWTGVCSHAQQVQAEPTGLSTYFFRIVPTLWLLQERRNHRIYQHQSIVDIVEKLLVEWNIDRRWHVDNRLYPPLEFVVQWGESDYTFICRMLEEAGISFWFVDNGAVIQLDDQPDAAEAGANSPIRWTEAEIRAAKWSEYISHVSLDSDVRPGAFTIRDYDYRRPAYALFGKATPAPAPEDFYEQYHYIPGGMDVDVDLEGIWQTPHADNRGAARHQEGYGAARAQRGLASVRAGRRAVGFEVNCVASSVGDVFCIAGHPNDELASDVRLLVTELEIQGMVREPPVINGKAAFAAEPWKPPFVTPRPRIRGVHAVTVVGPAGEEIAPDEFGRVNVQFPWDREGRSDAESSCWVHVSAPWGGLAYGWENLPRIGQEVLVDFLDGDPDRPMIVGRVFNAVQPVPYKLPDNKTISTWKSDSSIGSNGFNEIMFEDAAGRELVSIQAERDFLKLVKNDETITIGHDREKHVLVNEMDSTANDRMEVTLVDRTQVVSGNRVTILGDDRAWLVKQNRTIEIDDLQTHLCAGDRDAVVVGTKRELVNGQTHVHVNGDRREEIDGSQSLTVGDARHETVGGNALYEAGDTIHYEAGNATVLEGGNRITLKGAGGFIQIDASGVTIVGNHVRINAGGAPGTAPSASPVDPAQAKVAQVTPPDLPDVAAPELLTGKDTGVIDDLDWIELVLVEEDDPSKPVPFALYRLQTPDGRILHGRLDEHGRSLVSAIKSGECQVTWLQHDAKQLS